MSRSDNRRPGGETVGRHRPVSRDRLLDVLIRRVEEGLNTPMPTVRGYPVART